MSNSGPEPMKAVIKRLAASPGFRDAVRHRDVAARWAEAAGGEIAGRTRVVGLKQGRLVVQCDSQALAAELSGFCRKDLLARINALSDGRALDDIRFEVGSDFGKEKD